MTDGQFPGPSLGGDAPGRQQTLGLLDVIMVCAIASAIVLVTLLLMTAPTIRAVFDLPVSVDIFILLLTEPVAIFAGIYLVLILRDRITWPELGVRPAAPTWIAPAILSALGCLVFAGAMSQIFERFYQTSMLDEYLKVLAPDGLTLGHETVLILVVGCVVPFAEELLFRGVIYRWMRQRWGIVGSAIGSAFLFALAHTNVRMALQIFVTGIVLAVLYERSRSIFVSTLTHMTVNTISLILIFAYADATA